MAQSQCSRCLAPLQPEDRACPQCRMLVHAGQLASLRAKALEYEGKGQVQEARQLWTGAQHLLPPDSTQAQWIAEHLRALDEGRLPSSIDAPAAAGLSASPQSASRSASQSTTQSATQSTTQSATQSTWAKRLGPLAPLALLFAKLKSVLFALFKLKFLFSFAAFLGVYWALFGPIFGIGFACMVLIHEFGHYAEVKRRGLPAEMPVFLPGFGAYVQWQALGVSSEVRAFVSLAGPAAGLLASLLALLVYWQTGNLLWAALAHTGAWLNLINLMPVWMLDGASAARPLNGSGRLALLAICGLLFWWSGQGVLLLVAAGFAWQLFRGGFVREGVPTWGLLRAGVSSGGLQSGGVSSGGSLGGTTSGDGSLAVQLYFAALLAALAWILRVTPLHAGPLSPQ